MQTLLTPNIIPTKRAEPNKINEKWLWKKLSFSLNGKNKKKIYFFSVNTKNILSHVLKISLFSLMLRTCEITEIFNIFDEIYLVFTSKK